MRAPPAYCRLTVLTPGNRADVALPVDVSVADLVPMLMELLGEQGDPARPVPWRLTGPDRRRAGAGRDAGRPRRRRRGAAAARPGGPASAAPGVRRSRRRTGGSHRTPCRSRSTGSAGRARDRAGRRRARSAPCSWPARGPPATPGRLPRSVGPQRWRRSPGRRCSPGARTRRAAIPRPPGTWHSSPPCARYRSRPRPAGPPCPAHRAPRHCWRLRWRPAPRPRSPRSRPGRWSPRSSAPSWPPC